MRYLLQTDAESVPNIRNFSVMENKHATAGIDDLLFVWNHIHERFRQLQLYKPEAPKKQLTPDQLEEKEQEKG